MANIKLVDIQIDMAPDFGELLKNKNKMTWHLTYLGTMERFQATHFGMPINLFLSSKAFATLQR